MFKGISLWSSVYETNTLKQIFKIKYRKVKILKWQDCSGGAATPYSTLGYMGRLCPKGVAFFMLAVYTRERKIVFYRVTEIYVHLHCHVHVIQQ